MIQVANIEITDVTVTPSTVVAGAQYIIAATVEPRIFGIMDADGQMITDAAGNVITTQMHSRRGSDQHGGGRIYFSGRRLKIWQQEY